MQTSRAFDLLRLARLSLETGSARTGSAGSVLQKLGSLRPLFMIISRERPVREDIIKSHQIC